MAESGTSRQRSNEREEQRGIQGQGQLGQHGSGGIQRRGGYFPSISPRDFFTSSPLGLMRRFADEMDRVFSGFGGISPGTYPNEGLAWTPAVEVRENNNNLVVRAELPGLTEKDVRVETTPEGLVIQGERKQEYAGEEGGIQRSELTYGQFWRLIPLPDGAQVENAKANFENGILEITIPIPESQQRRRQIPISSSQGQSQQGQGSGGQRARSASQSG
jgi:HSP20 family protein